MSESETTGRCRSEMEKACGTSSSIARVDLVLADAIDRLTADVASIKAKVDAVAPEDVRHFVEAEKAWVAILEQDRDKMKDERNTAIMQREAAILQRDAAIHGRDMALADAARLNAELAARPAANSPEIQDSSPAAPHPAGVSDEQAAMDKDRAAVQRYCAAPQPAAPPPVWLTEREQHALRHILAADVEPAIRSILSRAGSPPSQTAPWWLTDDERAEIKHLLLIQRHNTGWTTERHAELDRLLSRAGSPPVVALPTVFARSLLGDELVALQQVKDAMDKAGVAWKEVPRE